MGDFVIAELSTGDGCGSGDLLFSWHMENQDITLGNPPGCTVGSDTTATYVGTGTTLSNTQVKDGSLSLYAPGSQRYASFDIVSEDIAKKDQGTVDFWVYIETYVSQGRIIDIRYDINNRISIQSLTGTYPQLRFDIVQSGSLSYAVSTQFPNPGIETGKWYHVIAKWGSTHSPKVQICADEGDGTSNCSPFTDTAWGTWGNTPNLLAIGSYAANAQYVYVDLLKIYGVWK